MIGILGGMGPQAGLDLAGKIIAETVASKDQDHVPVMIWSQTNTPDRARFLDDPSALDPAPAIAEGFLRLENGGAGVAGMACNTAHSPAIFERVTKHLHDAGAGMPILHLIKETVDHIQERAPGAVKIGILGTHGTLQSRLYHDWLERSDLYPLSPSDPHRLRDAIFHPICGIKAQSNPVSGDARNQILRAVSELIDAGAEAVILGCTELPLAVPDHWFQHIPLIDPARALARSLIRVAAPSQLRHLSEGS